MTIRTQWAALILFSLMIVRTGCSRADEQAAGEASQTQPAAAPRADRGPADEPRESFRRFVDAYRLSDGDTAAAFIDTSIPDGPAKAMLIRQIARCYIPATELRDAMVARFGDQVDTSITSIVDGLNHFIDMRDKIDQVTVSISGDVARLRLPGASSHVRMVRVDGKWLMDMRGNNAKQPEWFTDPQAVEQMFDAQLRVFELAMQDLEDAESYEQLMTAMRTHSARIVTPVMARIQQRARWKELPPGIGPADTPRESYRRFTDAFLRGDSAAAAAFIDASTSDGRAMAAIVAGVAQIYSSGRQLTDRINARFGDKARFLSIVAAVNSMNDLIEMHDQIDEAELSITGDRAVLKRPTASHPKSGEAAPFQVTLVRVDGKWLMDTSGRGSNQPDWLKDPRAIEQIFEANHQLIELGLTELDKAETYKQFEDAMQAHTRQILSPVIQKLQQEADAKK